MHKVDNNNKYEEIKASCCTGFIKVCSAHVHNQNVISDMVIKLKAILPIKHYVVPATSHTKEAMVFLSQPKYLIFG